MPSIPLLSGDANGGMQRAFSPLQDEVFGGGMGFFKSFILLG